MKGEIKEIERILATSGKYITYAERCYVLDYITNLQQIEQDHQRINGELREELEDYKSRNEKATKYIKSHKQRHDIDGSIADLDEFDILASPKTLLNILQGDDKDGK